MHDDVPLVVSEVNPEALDGHHGIIANPNCSTMQMVVALKPLHDEAGIERLVISTYQAVSGTGKRAVDELLDQSHALLHEQRDRGARRATRTRSPSTRSPTPASFAEGEDHTDEERKLMNETRKILGDPTIRISATCVRVPVVNGHSEAVNVQTREPLSPERARELLERAPGVTVLDDPERGALSARDRRRRQGRRVRRAHPPRPRHTSARWTCGSSRTTCARAPPRTRSSSPSCCTSAACCSTTRDGPGQPADGRRIRARLLGRAVALRKE